MAIIDQLDGPTPQGLSLEGRRGPRFERESQRSTSPIQAYVEGGELMESEDLLDGRSGGNFWQSSFYAPPSNPPVSFPDNYVGGPYYPSIGGPYNQNGPIEGLY